MANDDYRDLDAWLRDMSDAELSQYKTQLRQSLPDLSARDMESVLGRISTIPQLSDISASFQPQADLWQQHKPSIAESVMMGGGKALEYAFYPFTWAGMGAEKFGETPGARTGVVGGAFAPGSLPEGMSEETRAHLQTRPKWQPTPIESLLPGGERYEAYQQLPLWQQLGYEAIPLAASMALPGAAGIRAALGPAAKAGSRTARVASAALRPVAAVETAPGKVVRAIAKKIAPPSITLENRLASYVPEIATPYAAKRQNMLVADELAEWIGRITPKADTPIIRETIRQSATDVIRNRVQGFFARSYRIEPMLESMDKFVASGKLEVGGGKFTQALWRPVEMARNTELRALYESAAGLREMLAKSGSSMRKFFSERVTVEGLRLTHGEKIGIYLNSLNDQNLVHMVMGNRVPIKTIDAVVASLTPEERAAADFLINRVGKDADVLQNLVKKLTRRQMKTVENYWPIQIEWRAGPDITFESMLINEAKFRAISRRAGAGIKKGFALPRQTGALQPINLDAFDVFFRHLHGVEHYKAFAGVSRDLEQILASPSLKRAIIDRHGQASWDVLNQWVKDVSMTNPLAANSWGQWMARQLRVNATTAVLGFNIITALKQFPSFVTGSLETGIFPAIKGLFNFIMHPKETMALIRKYSPELAARVLEREVAEARLARGAGQRLISGKLTTRETFMFLTLNMDRLAVNGLWRGAFDDGLRLGMTAEKAAMRATRSIRRTQPYFDVKDLAEFWRSKDELVRAMTMFTNQLNQYWNYFRFQVIGRRAAGQISNLEVARRIFGGFIIPSYMIGAISRAKPAQDAGDFVKDMASMGFATVPLIGHWLSSAVMGWQNQGLISTELLERLHEITYQANQGEWAKVFAAVPEAVGFAAGLPVSQLRRSIAAMADLASGNSEEILSLIWGTYTMEKAAQETEAKRTQSAEDRIWASYPNEYRRILEEIKELEETDPAAGRRLQMQYPQILAIRRQIAIAKAREERSQALQERQEALSGR